MSTFDTFENVVAATVIDVEVTFPIWQRLIRFAKFFVIHVASAFVQIRVSGTFGIRNTLEIAMLFYKINSNLMC